MCARPSRSRCRGSSPARAGSTAAPRRGRRNPPPRSRRPRARRRSGAAARRSRTGSRGERTVRRAPSARRWSGCRPSTSFARHRSWSGPRARVMCLGSGSCTMMPWISGSRFSRRIVARSSPSVMKPGQVHLLRAHPDLGARLCVGTHVDPRGLVGAHEHGREAGLYPAVDERHRALGHLRLDLRGDRPAVQDRCGHGRILPTVRVGSPEELVRRDDRRSRRRDHPQGRFASRPRSRRPRGVRSPASRRSVRLASPSKWLQYIERAVEVLTCSAGLSPLPSVPAEYAARFEPGVDPRDHRTHETREARGSTSRTPRPRRTTAARTRRPSCRPARASRPVRSAVASREAVAAESIHCAQHEHAS